MAYSLDNYYLLCTESTVKLTYVRMVPSEGVLVAERDSGKEKTVTNIRRAKRDFLDLGQSNQWDYMATFTSGSEDPSNEIRAFSKWINNINTNHGWKVRYLALFELGDKGRRLHCHALLSGVPPGFIQCYGPADYVKLPPDVKRLYSQYKTEVGSRLAFCPWWKYGWSTLVPVDGSAKVVSYMTKYMTKQNLEFTTRFGGHSYFASKGLVRPEKKKIPADIVGAMWSRVPLDAWKSSFSGDDGRIMTSCFILDKDKISLELWDYYNKIYSDLQSGYL